MNKLILALILSFSVALLLSCELGGSSNNEQKEIPHQINHGGMMHHADNLATCNSCHSSAVSCDQCHASDTTCNNCH